MTNDKNIKRYNVGYMGLEEHLKGRYVAHGDHVEIVEKLKERIEELEGDIIEMKNQFFYE
jgi:ribosomal protein L19